jgi:hypothetical protein
MTTLLNQTAVDDEMAGIPEPPTFASPTEELKYRKQRAAAGYRMLARFGLDEGIAGHITIRDTHRLDHFWTAPFRGLLRTGSGQRPDLGGTRRNGCRGRRAAESSGVRHPLPHP